MTLGIHVVLGRINVRDASTRDRTTTRNISRHMSQYQVLGKAMVLKKSDFMFSVNKSQDLVVKSMVEGHIQENGRERK